MHQPISRIRWLALVAVLALAGAACGSSPTTTPPSGGSGGALVKGGTIKIGMTSDFHEALDPSREYYTIGWEFLRCCLARTLLSYNGHPTDQGGTELRPDRFSGTISPAGGGTGTSWVMACISKRWRC